MFAEVISGLDKAISDLSARMDLGLTLSDSAPIGFHEALNLEWRTIESRSIDPSQLDKARSTTEKSDTTRLSDSAFHQRTKALHQRLSDIETNTSSSISSSYNQDAFRSTVLRNHPPTTPEAWKAFDAWCPQESPLTMSISRFNASIPSSLRVSDPASSKRLSGPHHDDDIVLRAAVLGWTAVDAELLDPVWDVLRELDYALLANLCGEVERIAMLRLLRAVLAKVVYPFSPTRPTFPSYMAPTGLQEASLAAPSALTSMLLWPSLRNLLVARKTTHLPDHFLIRYFRSLRFSWLFDVRDVYRVNTRTGRYTFTQDFERRYHNLGTWTLKPDQKSLSPPSTTAARTRPRPRTIQRAGTKRPASPSTVSENQTSHARSVRAKTELPSSRLPPIGEDHTSNRAPSSQPAEPEPDSEAGSNSKWVARAWSDLGAATETMFKREREQSASASPRSEDSGYVSDASPLVKPEWFAPYAVEILSAMATDRGSLSRLRL